MRSVTEEYDLIKSFGYHIDVRGPRPTLVKGVSARQFETWKEALAAALIEIDPKLVRYMNKA